MSRWKIIALCLFAYSRRFSAIALFNNTAHPSNPTKYRALPLRHGYSALPLIWLVNRVSHMIVCASDFGIGASLEQWISGSWKPVAFFSRKFRPAQRSYSTYDRELTAVYEAIRYFRHFLEVYCDLSDSTLRPFVPLSLRERLFKLFHNPAYPGARASERLIRKRSVCPSMHKDIKAWCRACLDCQQSKVTRHIHLAPADFVAPEERFRHVHMDLVGPLPVSEGYQYCLTLIDRFSR